LILTEDGGESVHEPLLRNHTMNATSQIAIVGSNACPIESLSTHFILLLSHCLGKFHFICFGILILSFFPPSSVTVLT
jgi:hypothetical protein